MDWRLSVLVPNIKLPAGPQSSLFDASMSIPRTASKASFLETSVGNATLLLIDELGARHAGRAAGDEGRVVKNCIQILSGALHVAVAEELDDDGCEVLYGRAGLLYALLLLRSELSSALREASKASSSSSSARDVMQLFSDDNLQALVDNIVKRGHIGAKEYMEELPQEEREGAPSLMWSWHGKRYLGAAHGVAGILQMLVSCPTQIISTHWPDLLSTVKWLLAIQQPTGNWPSKAGRRMYYAEGGAATSKAAKRVSAEFDGGLIQWCHGAPGVLILLSKILSRTSQSSSLIISSSLSDSVIAALNRGGELVYTHGLLRKGVGLCHGTAGSVYTLLALSSVLDSSTEPSAYWFSRAAHLAQFATSYQKLEQKGEMRIPDEPYSLYEGVAGMCCAWAEVLARLDGLGGTGQRSGMPGYDDL